MRRALTFAALLALAGAAKAQDEVKNYEAPDIEIQIDSPDDRKSVMAAADPDVFLGIEQEVLRRRVTFLESRIEFLEGLLVELHGDAVAQRIETLLHGPDALEQRGIHQGGDRFAILGDDDAVAAVLHTVEHVAQVLAQGDSGGFGDHDRLP